MGFISKLNEDQTTVKLLYEPINRGKNRVIRGVITSEDAEFFYILPEDHVDAVAIRKDSVICITCRSKLCQNNRVEPVSRHSRGDNFSYAKWWKREKVEEEDDTR